MPADPQAFAQRVIDAFAANGNFTDLQIERANGPSSSTMTKLRKVADGEQTMAEPREPTWSKIDNAAGWLAGSARKVWAGGEPVRVSTSLHDAQSFVESPGERVESGVSNEDLLREIVRSRAAMDQIASAQREQQQTLGRHGELLTSLSTRVEKLEERGT